jgi:Protein of unknown function (DUF5131)
MQQRRGKAFPRRKDAAGAAALEEAAQDFVCSMTDLFADFVPDEMIDRVFAVMALCPHHTFQALTKRPKRMREFIAAHWRNQVELEAEAIRPSKGLRSRRNGVLNLRRRRLGRKRPRIRVSATSAYAGPQRQSVSATISY